VTHTDERWQDVRENWQHLGRAAEHFARRVARDARRFAARMEEHVGDLAGEVRREWRCGPGARWHRGGGSADDMRKVFEEARGVLAAVLEGVDDLITDVFSGRGEEPWSRIVTNSDATCAGCAKTIAAGSEAFLRRRPGGRELRCA